jgi:hypothetical protein
MKIITKAYQGRNKIAYAKDYRYAERRQHLGLKIILALLWHTVHELCTSTCCKFADSITSGNEKNVMTGVIIAG